MTLALVLFLAFADLASLKTEPDPNHRSELALTHAEEQLDSARQAYQAGNNRAEVAAVQEVTDSITLCYASLEESHGAPRKSKYYKHAELRVSALMRRLAGFRDEVSFEFRPSVDAALKTISDIHDQLIDDIMSRKK